MNVARLLPPVSKPPHDPKSHYLSPVAGWRSAPATDGVEVSAVDGSLRLAPYPGTRRVFTEPSGSFGGLTTPTNVAVDEDKIYLLATSGPELKRYDPCTCRFETIRHFGKDGTGALHFTRATGIAIRVGSLYLCDAGNHRVGVFALPDLVPAGEWTVPPDQEPVNRWEPYAVAFDSRGRAYVSDHANGRVHRFARSGRWQAAFAGFGLPTHVAVDCRDRVWIVDEADESVHVLDRNGSEIQTDVRADAVHADFEPLDFEVDARGNLYLQHLCAGTRNGEEEASGVFNREGVMIPFPDRSADPLFVADGTFISEPLDSRLYKCQWHRVILKGILPPAGLIHVDTYTADQPAADLATVRWDSRLIARGFEKGAWDGLIRSGKGRYLWLRLRFHGDQQSTPTVDSIRIEFPRISLRRYLPAVFGEDPLSADFTDRFLGLYDTTIRGFERTIDEQAELFDPLSTPAEAGKSDAVDFLSWLASWVGITLNRHWSEAKRRRYLKQAGRLFSIRGTREGLWRTLILFLGMTEENDCCCSAPKSRCRPGPPLCRPGVAESGWEPPPLILEHFRLRRWLFLGAGRLGDQAKLWGHRIVNRSQLDENARVGGTQLISTPDPLRDPFHVYAHRFSVFVPCSFASREGQKQGLERLIATEKPAHTVAQIEYVEPRFRIGFQSMIGLDAVVGRYPQGVPLDAKTELGTATVLSPGPDAKATEAARGRSRVGKSSILK